jgi:hypothetical protein
VVPRRFGVPQATTSLNAGSGEMVIALGHPLHGLAAAPGL